MADLFSGASSNVLQLYTGFLFHTGSTNDLAGSFLAFNAGGSANQPEFGWYAYR
ncbi:MAG TPA: hypothetical protein VHB98_03735 [Chloroflexota bacterium]|nr:hypothetical protein [Chloroflexota bacterium]